MTQETTNEEAATETTSSLEEVDALLNRLRRIEGQIRGIHRMLAEDAVGRLAVAASHDSLFRLRHGLAPFRLIHLLLRKS